MKIKLEVPNKILPAFNNLRSNLHDAIVMYGGRGGAKSQALVAVGILESYIDDGVILCCREIQKSISDSLYSAIVSGIHDRGLSGQFKILNNEITNLRTGARFIFAGLKHNITSIKSINKLRVVLVDEAENVSQESWDYLRPTPRYGNVRTYVAFNPRFETDATYQEFVVKADERTLVIKVNWYDNPWFPKSLNNQRLRDMRGDAGRYQWIWGGEFLRIAENAILAKLLKCKNFEVDWTFGDPLIGVDWGFSVDPAAVVECYVKDRTLYIRNAGAILGLRLDDTADWLIKHVPNIKKFTSRADCSRPETINKVRNDIDLMKPCLKWPGCVEDGVSTLLSFDEIVIHPEAECCFAELTSYCYKLDKFGEPTAVIEDKNNHYADALRYAVEPMVSGKRYNLFD